MPHKDTACNFQIISIVSIYETVLLIGQDKHFFEHNVVNNLLSIGFNTCFG